ncbi:hypothetical protein L596_020542 [Steinernema carpocapsae]|uniref:ABC transmembrane type-1 domain-containing protein n=1 Tax=Steinernema carpocapsae TaxID=34508 RepID=A0A4U5MU14_STECR|nr:hypothetical protein L596_020542 [Steinernema carpocapsae]
MGFKKKLTITDPSSEVDTVDKVSVITLFRYASKFDLLILTIGSCMAAITGLGFPFISVIFGNITGSFVKATTLIDYPGVHLAGNYTLDDFSDDVIGNCLDYICVGIAVFTASTVQVMCFLTAGENMIHRMRTEFLRSIIRQDIPWYDKNQSGTLTTKLFE